MRRTLLYACNFEKRFGRELSYEIDATSMSEAMKGNGLMRFPELRNESPGWAGTAEAMENVGIVIPTVHR